MLGCRLVGLIDQNRNSKINQEVRLEKQDCAHLGFYKGHLVRSIKFAVDAQGKIVDNGIATANKLGNDRVIVPVQVLGDSDGQWDKTAWKTDAFYSNPLTGFTPSP
jgi:hypothetical protein